MKQFALGAIPDTPDENDRLKVVSEIQLPTKFDLAEYAGDPYNQGEIGSCTGQTLAKCSEIMARRKGTIDNLQLVSPYFTYALARSEAGWPQKDRGAFLRDVMKVSHKIGRLPDALYSGRNDWRQMPTFEELELAGHGKINGYERISVYGKGDIIRDMRIVLAGEHLPIAIGARVFQSIYDVGRDGLIRMPTRRDKQAGGHAMTIIGYDNDLKCFIGINSWGKIWGKGGFFYLPYEYLLQYVHDIWTFSKDYY